MARLRFPDSASVDRVQATADLALLSASGATARVYLDAAGTQLADIQNGDGSGNPTATLILDSLSRLPEFLGPTSGADVLYVRVDGGGPLAVEAQLSDRFAVQDARIAEGYIAVTEGPLPVAKFADEVVSTDDWTQAIRSAVEQVAVAASGGVNGASLMLPQGRVRITDTIELNQQAVTLSGFGRGGGPTASVIKWAGPAGQPMFRLLDYSACAFEDMSLIGDDTNAPSVGILSDNPGPGSPAVGTNEHLRVSRVAFGRSYTTVPEADRGAMGMAVSLSGAVVGNNDQFRIEDSQAHDCTVAAWHIGNAQATWGVLDNLTANVCARGLWSRANVDARSLHFNRCGVDLYIENNSRLNLDGYYSEHSALLWDLFAGSSIDIRGGKALLQEEMALATEYATSRLASYGALTLRNLLVTDQPGLNIPLRISGSSSNPEPVYALLRGNVLPNGDSDAGYDIDGFLAGAPIYVDIQQGTYWRRQVVRSLNAPGFHVPAASRMFQGPFLTSNVPANAPATSMVVATDHLRLPVVRAGSITGVGARTSTAITAGSITVETVKVNAAGATVPTGLTVTLSAGVTATSATQAEFLNLNNTLAPGEQIGTRFTSSADLAPLTCDIAALVEITAG